jgi:hypothetical protein
MKFPLLITAWTFNYFVITWAHVDFLLLGVGKTIALENNRSFY